MTSAILFWRRALSIRYCPPRRAWMISGISDCLNIESTPLMISSVLVTIAPFYCNDTNWCDATGCWKSLLIVYLILDCNLVCWGFWQGVYSLLVHTDQKVRRVAFKLVQSLEMIKYDWFSLPLILLINTLKLFIGVFKPFFFVLSNFNDLSLLFLCLILLIPRPRNFPKLANAFSIFN